MSESWRAVLAAFPTWEVWDDGAEESADEMVGRDLMLGREVAAGHRPPTFRLWAGRRSLVASRAESRTSEFPAAAADLAARGWPVVVRDTGGSVVPHGPGVLNLSLAMPRPVHHGFSIESVYLALCRPLEMVLSDLGLPATMGAVPGAFCDGAYNLVVRCRKVAGTAQAWRCRSGGDSGCVLAHAALLVDLDLEVAVGAANRFRRLLAEGHVYHPASMATIRRLLAATGESGVSIPGRSLVLVVRERIVERVRGLLNASTTDAASTAASRRHRFDEGEHPAARFFPVSPIWGMQEH